MIGLKVRPNSLSKFCIIIINIYIPDALENAKNVSFNQSDAYWNDLISFRNQNRNDCVSRETAFNK